MITWSTLSLARAGVVLIDCVHKTPAAQTDGFAYVAIPQMKNGHIDFADARRISPGDFKEWTKKANPQKYDVVLSRRTNPGVTAVDRTGTPFALGQNLVLLRADGRSVFPPFLRWLCKSPAWWEQIDKYLNVGAVFSSLRCADVPKFELPIPPLDEQHRIAGLLDSLDDKIQLNRQASATLEEMARALYRSWFVDFDPVRAKEAGEAPAYMNGATSALFPDRFGEDGLPSGWTWTTLDKVSHQHKETVKPMEQPDKLFWHFSLPAFDAGVGPSLDPGSSILSNKLGIPNNAILYSRLNPSIPRVWWARFDADLAQSAASTEFFVAVARREIETPWLYTLLSSEGFQEKVVSRATGTSNSHQRIKPANLAEIELVQPPVAVIEAFGEATLSWFERIHLSRQETSSLTDLRDTLLPKLMSGELRVRDAEAAVAEVA
jgi:type I restriction enzyme S subunit